MSAVAIDRSVPKLQTGWKWFLLLLCALFSPWVAASVIDNFGFGGQRPWYGWWGAVILPSGQSYQVTVKGVVGVS